MILQRLRYATEEPQRWRLPPINAPPPGANSGDKDDSPRSLRVHRDRLLRPCSPVAALTRPVRHNSARFRKARPLTCCHKRSTSRRSLRRGRLAGGRCSAPQRAPDYQSGTSSTPPSFARSRPTIADDPSFTSSRLVRALRLFRMATTSTDPGETSRVPPSVARPRGRVRQSGHFRIADDERLQGEREHGELRHRRRVQGRS